jgi:chaperone required for assembly of F1-ATPase
VKRFYNAVSTAADGDGWRVLLDGRAIKTVGGRPQVVPSAPLAEAMAEEWAAQGEELNLAGFIFRDMADYALDVVAPDRATAVSGLLAYAETDTLCYRADPDEPFYRHQQEVWEPLLVAVEARHGVRFRRVSGVIHRPQPVETLATLAGHLAGLDDFALAALRTLASLAASLSIGLMALEASPGEAGALWDAASLEEEWQADLWGRDYEAEELRARRRAAFLAAGRFAALARGI